MHSPSPVGSAHAVGTPEHFHIVDAPGDNIDHVQELAHAFEHVIERYSSSQASLDTPSVQNRSRPFGDISGILQDQPLVQHG